MIGTFELNVNEFQYQEFIDNFDVAITTAKLLDYDIEYFAAPGKLYITFKTSSKQLRLVLSVYWGGDRIISEIEFLNLKKPGHRKIEGIEAIKTLSRKL